MKNDFIDALFNCTEAVEALVQLAHPGYSKKYQVYRKYDWLIIEGKGMGVGIEWDLELFGPGHKKEDFEKALDKELIKLWRFADDSLYGTPNSDLRVRTHTVNLIVKHFNIPRPTVKQVMDYYYAD